MRMLVLALAATLAACTPGSLTSPPSSPAAVANATVLDEKVGIAAETLYYGANRAAALAIRTGVVKDTATIKRIGQVDLQLKAELQKIRVAYRAGNAASYDAAFRQLNVLVRQLYALL